MVSLNWISHLHVKFEICPLDTMHHLIEVLVIVLLESKVRNEMSSGPIFWFEIVSDIIQVPGKVQRRYPFMGVNEVIIWEGNGNFFHFDESKIFFEYSIFISVVLNKKISYPFPSVEWCTISSLNDNDIGFSRDCS